MARRFTQFMLCGNHGYFRRAEDNAHFNILHENETVIDDSKI